MNAAKPRSQTHLHLMYLQLTPDGLPEPQNTYDWLLKAQLIPFDFKIPAEDGYGEYDEEAVVDLPLDIFKDEDGEIPTDVLVAGNMIPMTNEDGHQLMGQVVEVTDTNVVMDFNHPLAGREMWFKGAILDVRDATREELNHGHVHGIGGVQH